MGVTTVIKDYGTDILNAIRENNLQKLKAILEKQLKSNHKIAKLCTSDIKHKPTKKFACPLILAARQEEPRIMKYMMDKGTDPNFVHHTVFSSKRREIVTALHISVDLGYYDTVQVLLDANADCNIGDHNMETPLHIAVKKADSVMTRMLLSKGADPSMLDRRGNAALHIATVYGHLQLVRTLLKYSADVYQKGQYGTIPPHIAAKEGHIHLIQLFCSHDVGNINNKISCYADKREKAPIHLAAENGHVETVLALLDQFDAEVNLKDSDGNTPLHCCVLNQYNPHRMRDKDYFTETARVLLKFRVSVNSKNMYGDTALHLAAMNQFQRIVELLLQVGANPMMENEENLKPIDVVPDYDPVTKQVLKNAMLNPRPAISGSMLTLRKGSEMDNSSVNTSMLSIHKPRIDRSRSNLSVASHSTMMSYGSVFIEDVKAHQPRSRSSSQSGDSRKEHRHKTGPEPHRTHSPPNRNEESNVYNEITDISQNYSKVEKKRPLRSTQQQTDRKQTSSKGTQQTYYEDGEQQTDRKKTSSKGIQQTYYEDGEQQTDRKKTSSKGIQQTYYEDGEQQTDRKKTSSKGIQQTYYEDGDESFISSHSDTTIQTMTTSTHDATTLTSQQLQRVMQKQHKDMKYYEEDTASEIGSIISQGTDSQYRSMDKDRRRPKPSPRMTPIKKFPDSKSMSQLDEFEEKTNFEHYQSYQEETVRQGDMEKILQSNRQIQSARSEGSLPGYQGSPNELGQAISINGSQQQQQSIRVNTVPGRPGTIELQFGGEPITISVDTQGAYNVQPQYQQDNQYTSSSQYPDNYSEPQSEQYSEQYTEPFSEDPLQSQGSQSYQPYEQSYNEGYPQDFNGSMDSAEMEHSVTSSQPEIVRNAIKQKVFEVTAPRKEPPTENSSLDRQNKPQPPTYRQVQQQHKVEDLEEPPWQQHQLQQQVMQQVLQQQHLKKAQKQEYSQQQSQRQPPKPQQRSSRSHGSQSHPSLEPIKSTQYTYTVETVSQVEAEVSPDTTPNTSPKYKNFSQAMAFAKEQELKNSPHQSPVSQPKWGKSQKQAVGIVSTPEASHWKVNSPGKTAVIESTGPPAHIGNSHYQASAQVAKYEQEEHEEDEDFEDELEEMPHSPILHKAGQHPQEAHERFYSLTPDMDLQESGSGQQSPVVQNRGNLVFQPVSKPRKQQVRQELPQFQVSTDETSDIYSKSHPGKEGTIKQIDEAQVHADVSSERTFESHSEQVTTELLEYASEPGARRAHSLDYFPTPGSDEFGGTRTPDSVYSEGGRGLKMRVTGEVPKAYSRAEKNSARKAFMLHPPVGIESSSETSDNEFNTSRGWHSDDSPPEDPMKAQLREAPKPVYSTEGTLSPPSPGSYSSSPKPELQEKPFNVKIIGPLPKPYKSFGKIETKTDALLEALEEEGEDLRSIPSPRHFDFEMPVEAPDVKQLSASPVHIARQSPVPAPRVMKPKPVNATTDPSKAPTRYHYMDSEHTEDVFVNNPHSEVAETSVATSPFKKNIRMLNEGPETWEAVKAEQEEKISVTLTETTTVLHKTEITRQDQISQSTTVESITTTVQGGEVLEGEQVAEIVITDKEDEEDSEEESSEDSQEESESESEGSSEESSGAEYDLDKGHIEEDVGGPEFDIEQYQIGSSKQKKPPRPKVQQKVLEEEAQKQPPKPHKRNLNQKSYQKVSRVKTPEVILEETEEEDQTSPGKPTGENTESISVPKVEETRDHKVLAIQRETQVTEEYDIRMDKPVQKLKPTEYSSEELNKQIIEDKIKLAGQKTEILPDASHRTELDANKIHQEAAIIPKEPVKGPDLDDIEEYDQEPGRRRPGRHPKAVGGWGEATKRVDTVMVTKTVDITAKQEQGESPPQDPTGQDSEDEEVAKIYAAGEARKIARHKARQIAIQAKMEATEEQKRLAQETANHNVQLQGKTIQHDIQEQPKSTVQRQVITEQKPVEQRETATYIQETVTEQHRVPTDHTKLASQPEIVEGAEQQAQIQQLPSKLMAAKKGGTKPQPPPKPEGYRGSPVQSGNDVSMDPESKGNRKKGGFLSFSSIRKKKDRSTDSLHKEQEKAGQNEETGKRKGWGWGKKKNSATLSLTTSQSEPEKLATVSAKDHMNTTEPAPFEHPVHNAIATTPDLSSDSAPTSPSSPEGYGIEGTVMGAPSGSKIERRDTIKRKDGPFDLQAIKVNKKGTDGKIEESEAMSYEYEKQIHPEPSGVDPNQHISPPQNQHYDPSQYQQDTQGLPHEKHATQKNVNQPVGSQRRWGPKRDVKPIAETDIDADLDIKSQQGQMPPGVGDKMGVVQEGLPTQPGGPSRKYQVTNGAEMMSQMWAQQQGPPQQWPQASSQPQQRRYKKKGQKDYAPRMASTSSFEDAALASITSNIHQQQQAQQDHRQATRGQGQNPSGTVMHPVPYASYSAVRAVSVEDPHSLSHEWQGHDDHADEMERMLQSVKDIHSEEEILADSQGQMLADTHEFGSKTEEQISREGQEVMKPAHESGTKATTGWGRRKTAQTKVTVEKQIETNTTEVVHELSSSAYETEKPIDESTEDRSNAQGKRQPKPSGWGRHGGQGHPSISKEFPPDVTEEVSAAWRQRHEIPPQPEVVEMPSQRTVTAEDEGFQGYATTPKAMTAKTKAHRPGKGARPGEAVSDSEALTSPKKKKKKKGKSISFHDIHSENEVHDLELPSTRDPEKSLQEAAMETIQADLKHQQPVKPHRMVPADSDRPINYTQGVYRPQPVHWQGMSAPGTGGQYDDSQLTSQRRDVYPSITTGTESEAEADTEDVPQEDPFIEEKVPQQQHQYLTPHIQQPGFFHSTPEDEKENLPSAFHPVSPGGNKRVTIVEKKKKKKKKKDRAPKTEPGPVDFSKYGLTARLWMEQVDKKTVQKSRTMKVAVMPEGHQIPHDLTKNIKDNRFSTMSDDVFLPPQWVIARGRSLRRSKYLSSTSSSLGQGRSLSAMSGGESDYELSDRPMSPGRQKLLFFRVGSNWRDLAWVLFDGIQSDSETIRMIKDIQLKHPGKLTEMVHDMIKRWWKRKGSEATIEELQRALDVVAFGYLEEECFDQRNALTSFTDTEDELDVSEVSDTDPDVSRLIEEYDIRSMNASFELPGSPGPEMMSLGFNPDVVLRRLDQRTLSRRSNLDMSRDSIGRRSRTSSRPNSSQDDLLDESSDYMFIVQPQLKQSDIRHETTI